MLIIAIIYRIHAHSVIQTQKFNLILLIKTNDRNHLSHTVDHN